MAAVAPNDCSKSDTIDLRVLCLNGEAFTLQVPGCILGREIRQMVLDRIGYRTGAKLMLHHDRSQLVLHQTLQEQGIFGNIVALSYTLVSTDLYAAWCFIRGISVSEDSFAVDG